MDSVKGLHDHGRDIRPPSNSHSVWKIYRAMVFQEEKKTSLVVFLSLLDCWPSFIPCCSAMNMWYRTVQPTEQLTRPIIPFQKRIKTTPPMQFVKIEEPDFSHFEACSFVSLV